MTPSAPRLNVIEPDTSALDALKQMTVAVVGYGNQGRPQALNMRESGLRVIVGQRGGSPRATLARDDGFEVLAPDEAVAQATVVMMLTPDDQMGAVWRDHVAPSIGAGGAIVFSHGFAIHYRLVEPRRDIDVLLVAPKGIGTQVRSQYLSGNGVPMLVGVHQDATGGAMRTALGLAMAVGRGRAGIYETNFRDETECDLFGEQAVLCGGVTELLRQAYDTLVEAGYPRELAYFECLHELKLIVDLVYERGITTMFGAISPTAEYGAHTRGTRLVNEGTREELRRILAEIRDGRFAAELGAETAAGHPTRRRIRAEWASHDSEVIGRELRARMPWMPPQPKG